DRTIKEMEAVEGYEDRSLFFASHPQPEERMEVLRQLAKQVKTEESKDVGAGRLHRVMAPIRADLIRDELNVRRFGAFEVLLDQLIEDGENLAELYYFKGEMRRLRAEDGDLEEALKFYSKAREAPGHAPADLERSAGLVQHKLGRVQEARKSFAAYLRANPRAADVEIIRHLMQAKAR
ncbi:MAG TPA: tetratricopeptide repeat protein, partial [Alphaproteobacteria bacterium]|nr:tetratricopeptide repeat protein [Alphaproteobacteria bacterium]